MTTAALFDALFDDQPDFLQHTLRHADMPVPLVEAMLPDGTRVTRLGLGALQFLPPDHDARRLVLSAGIHGNETAPIEILNGLVDEILSGKLPVRVPLLALLGNPWAMNTGQREITHNLNRLFNGRHIAEAYRDSREGQRAAQLEDWVIGFVGDGTGTGNRIDNRIEKNVTHYDLHTAIRDSARERFAVYPFLPGRTLPDDQKAFLDACAIDTVLIQQESAGTFSAFSAERFGAQSFTVELGKVHPFGQNDLSRYAGVRDSLATLIQGQSPAGDPRRVESFVVVHEIVNTGADFMLHVPDDVPNFTEYREGALIWSGDGREYRVHGEPQYIVFPNREVGKGQRAGLMVRGDGG